MNPVSIGARLRWSIGLLTVAVLIPKRKKSPPSSTPCVSAGGTENANAVLPNPTMMQASGVRNPTRSKEPVAKVSRHAAAVQSDESSWPER